MSTTTKTDTFARFVEILADSLDDHETSGEALAASLHLSRFHFDRLVSAAAGEPPAALRRRILLERAAYRLVSSDEDVLSVALEAGYSSHEAFTRAFVRAYGRSPSQWRRRPTSSSRRRAGALQPTRGPARPRSRKGDTHGAPDPHGRTPRLARRRDAHASRGAPDEVLDVPVEISVEGPTTTDAAPALPRLVGQLAMWDAAIHDRPYDFGVEDGESVASMRARLAESRPAFLTQVREIADAAVSTRPSSMRSAIRPRCSPTAG